MSGDSTWRPSGAPYSLTAPDRFAVVHFWASWNGIDRAMDSALRSLAFLFDEGFALRSSDFDREENLPLVRKAHVVNLPAIAFVVEGEPQETVIGLRSVDELRSRIEEWRRRAAAI